MKNWKWYTVRNVKNALGKNINGMLSNEQSQSGNTNQVFVQFLLAYYLPKQFASDRTIRPY